MSRQNDRTSKVAYDLTRTTMNNNYSTTKFKKALEILFAGCSEANLAF